MNENLQNIKAPVSFHQEIREISNVIKKIPNKEKNITDKNKIKDNMCELIEVVSNFLKDKDNQSNFANEQYSNELLTIAHSILLHLAKMSEKLISNTEDCYSEDSLGKLENILRCFDTATKDDINLYLHRQFTNTIFAIMQNIIEHKKQLLFSAIENLQSNQQKGNLNLNSVLSNLMEANVRFFPFINIDGRAFDFLKKFYDEVFAKLIKFLDDNNIDDNLKKYNLNLIDIIFDGILRSSDKMTRSCDNNPAYTIGDLFINKYYLRNNTKNKVDWRVPNLDRFISKYDYFGTFHKYIDYFPIKIELMREKIKILKDGKVQNRDKEFNIDWTEKYDTGKFVYGYFDFDPKEFFDLGNDSDEAKKFRLNIGYVISLEEDLEYIWNLCNKLFHRYKQNCEDDPSSKMTRNKYENIKKDRANIYSVLCGLETEKQKLLKERLVNIIKSKFRPLSLFEKIFRLSLLAITFLIYASVFILVKTLRKFFHCFIQGLECIGQLRFFQCSDNCKDKWAEACEKGYLDGLKINGKEIDNRIKWYETKNWLLVRRILLPIDLAIHIIIGIFWR